VIWHLVDCVLCCFYARLKIFNALTTNLPKIVKSVVFTAALIIAAFILTSVHDRLFFRFFDALRATKSAETEPDRRARHCLVGSPASIMTPNRGDYNFINQTNRAQIAPDRRCRIGSSASIMTANDCFYYFIN
jgi:hypothetical protein